MKRPLIQGAGFMRQARRYAARSHDFLENLEATLSLMELDVFDPRLRTHKLKGQFKDCWACSAGYDLRVLFQFVKHEGKEAILLLAVGSHDEVY